MILVLVLLITLSSGLNFRLSFVKKSHPICFLSVKSLAVLKWTVISKSAHKQMALRFLRKEKRNKTQRSKLCVVTVILVSLTAILQNFPCFPIKQNNTLFVVALKCGQNILFFMMKLQYLEIEGLIQTILDFTGASLGFVFVGNNPCKACFLCMGIDDLRLLFELVVTNINKPESI